MVVRLRGPEIELEVQEESVQGTTGSRSTELIKWRCWTKSCRASGELRLIKAKFWPPAPSESKDGPSISNRQFFFQGRDRHCFEFASDAEDAFLSMAHNCFGVINW